MYKSGQLTKKEDYSSDSQKNYKAQPMDESQSKIKDLLAVDQSRI